MRKPLALTLFLLGSAPILAADAGSLLAQAQAAEARCEPEAALPLYLSILRSRPDDPEILLKVARQHSDLADGRPTAAEKMREIKEALGYVEQAVRLQPRNAVAQLSLAICHGKLAAWSEHARDKISYSRLVEEEAQRALQLDPRYAWADDILGQWNCALASLSGTERFFVMIFYGGLPPASYEQGLADLRRAVELEPQEPAHRVELGFAYLAAGRQPEAKAEFIRGLALPGHVPSDREEKTRAQAALLKLGAVAQASPADKS